MTQQSMRSEGARHFSAPRLRISGLVTPTLALVVAILDLLFVWLDGSVAVAFAKTFGFGVGFETQRVAGQALALSIFLVAALYLRGLYDPRRLLFLPPRFAQIAVIWLVIFSVFVALIFPFRVDAGFSRASLALFFGTGLASLAGTRAFARLTASRLATAGHLSGPHVVVLSDEQHDVVTKKLLALRQPGLRVQRIFILPQTGETEAGAALENVLDRLVRYVRRTSVDEVVVVMRWARVLALQGSLETLSKIPHQIRLLPEEELTWLVKSAKPGRTLGQGVVLQRSPLALGERLFKRGFDLTLATAGLIVLSPVFLASAIAIVIESGGPVLFRQWRGGYNERRFRICKFRTMRAMDDGPTIKQATRKDPRITKVGRVLRKYSIDELPQLFNVVMGDMSLVGPRPHALAHDRAYSQIIARYPARYNINPGITGWAQINGRRGETATPEEMQRRVDLDLIYIQDWSPWLDIRILAATVRQILNPSDHVY